MINILIVVLAILVVASATALVILLGSLYKIRNYRAHLDELSDRYNDLFDYLGVAYDVHHNDHVNGLIEEINALTEALS